MFDGDKLKPTYTSRITSPAFSFSFFFASSSALVWFFFSRASFWPIIRFTYGGVRILSTEVSWHNLQRQICASVSRYPWWL